MMPFEECPICGGEFIGQEVGKLLKGGVRIFSSFSRKLIDGFDDHVAFSLDLSIIFLYDLFGCV